MRTQSLYNIILLAEDKKLNGEKLNKICDKGVSIISEVNEAYYNHNKIKSAILVPQAFFTIVQGLIREQYEIKRRKQIASNVFSVKEDLITGEHSEFISEKNNKYVVFVNDLSFDATIEPTRMEDLEIIWGKANFKKLHDFKNLSSLEIVMGDIETSTAENLEGLSNLKIVTGDIHAERLDNIDFLKGLEYLGGKIYHKEQEFSLEQLKEKQKVNIK